MARVPYLHREGAGAEQSALYDRLEAERKVPTANIFLALANAPVQLNAFLTYANALRGSELSPKLRELAILAVGHATNSRYEIATTSRTRWAPESPRSSWQRSETSRTPRSSTSSSWRSCASPGAPPLTSRSPTTRGTPWPST